MQFINQLLKDDFFFKKKKIKRLLIYKNLNLLTNHHFKNSKEYKKILTLLGYKQNKTYEIDKLPFIPVRLFKNHDLLSVKKEKIIKILNSSGTTNNQKSKIFEPNFR